MKYNFKRVNEQNLLYEQYYHKNKSNHDNDKVLQKKGHQGRERV